MMSITNKLAENFKNFFRRYSYIGKSVIPSNKKASHAMSIFKVMLSRSLYALQAILFFIPVKKNRVMVCVHARKGFTCNPKYIVKELKELYGDKLDIIWVTMYPESCGEIKKLDIKVVKNNSPKHVMAYLRTHVYITNDYFPFWALHAQNQIWINTWHGAMNYKHIGYDYVQFPNKYDQIVFTMKNRTPNYYISGSRFFTNDTAKSFRLDKSIFLPTGLPRNDVFFKNSKLIYQSIRTQYNLAKDKKIVLYAPTFRESLEASTYGLEFKELCKALEKRFGGSWVVLLRNHYFVTERADCTDVVDVSAYHDMQELLCASDVLVSDYSSCLYDYSLTGRPSFIYAPDIDYYITADRSFAYPSEKWPYSIAKSNMELQRNIAQFNEHEYKEKIERHLSDTGSFDNGSASEQVARLIASYCL